jgi:dihydropyrimidine dehydrogenase (NAD+) subunit PreT
MPEYKRPTNLNEYAENFSQIKPNMTATMAYNESARCLFCYDAPCQQACPTGIDIALFIKQIHTGNLQGSARTIYNSNYFANICGKVCPTEVLCEGACVHNHAENKPIEIGRLQSFAAADAIQKQTNLYAVPTPKNKGKVAIIGAGPAGIAAACELSKAGIEAHIFEAKAAPSGLAIYGVAPYKITNQEIIEEVNYLQAQFGFQISYNYPITDAAQLADLEQRFDFIFLGIGLGKTNPILSNPNQLTNVIGATEFIAQLKTDFANTYIGKNVVVVGGGNTAMDAASESARMGANSVHLVYRKSKSDMSAYEFEYDLAKHVGVQGVFGYAPKELLGTNAVQAISFTSENGETLTLDCDMVILATGQQKQISFLSQISKLATAKNGCIIVNNNFQTSNPLYFAAGDAVNGGAEVVNATAEAKKAAQAIIKLLIV